MVRCDVSLLIRSRRRLKKRGSLTMTSSWMVTGGFKSEGTIVVTYLSQSKPGPVWFCSWAIVILLYCLEASLLSSRGVLICAQKMTLNTFDIELMSNRCWRQYSLLWPVQFRRGERREGLWQQCRVGRPTVEPCPSWIGNRLWRICHQESYTINVAISADDS